MGERLVYTQEVAGSSPAPPMEETLAESGQLWSASRTSSTQSVLGSAALLSGTRHPSKEWDTVCKAAWLRRAGADVTGRRGINSARVGASVPTARVSRCGMRHIGEFMRWRPLIITAAIAGAALVTQIGPSPAGASTLPTGFRDSVVLSGLTNPTVLQFAPDGRIFVGQKNGVIKVFQGLTDTNPITFADLSGNVHDFWDRGLLGLALPPTSRRALTSTRSTRTTPQSAARHRRGATPARHRQARPPTAAWYLGGCRDCRSAGTS